MSKTVIKDPLFLNPEQRDRIYSRVRQGTFLRIGTSFSMGFFGWIAYLTDLLPLTNITGITGCMVFLMVMPLPLNALIKNSKSRKVIESISLLTNLLETLGYTTVIYFLGGFRGLYLSPVYAVFIAYLGVIAPFRYPFIVAGFCTGSLSLFLTLEYYGFLPPMAPLSEPIIPARFQIGVVLAIIVFLFLSAYISSTTGKRLRNSRKRLEEQNRIMEENARQITQADIELRQAHMELEKRVESRTAELLEANNQLREEIQERRQAEEALLESEERFASFMEHMPGFAILKDHNRRVFYMNPRFKEEFDINEETLLSRTTDQFWPGEVADRIRKNDEEVLSTGQPRATVEDLPSKTGLRTYQSIKFPIPRPAGPPWLGGIAVDITELKRAEVERGKLEAHMREVQKLESLGILAGGIAHDFNNLLMAILGNADLALLTLSPASPARENINEISQASQRAAELCRQMLAYSGKGRFVVGCYNLSEIVREMTQMLEVSISKKASLRFSFFNELPPVEADATQIRQIIMNLITNASEALEEKSGLISVSTGFMDCDQAYLSGSFLDEKLPEGRYVFLEVSDTGQGMDLETRRKIFDPFFTTKFTGRGLGLAAVLGIVRAHRGAIKVYSEPGKGTTVKILFPAVEGAVEEQAAKPMPGLPATRRGTILLVDDDPHVRQVGSLMLKQLGFQTLTAANGQEGLELFRIQGDQIDCIILDLTMPVMDGEEAFRELRRIQSNVRVILSSGYSEQDVIQQFAGKGLAGFIQKPYTIPNLQAILNQVLN